MAATNAQIAEIRLMCALEDADTLYTHELVKARIEDYPLVDCQGEVSVIWDTSTDPPTATDNERWIPTYDLHAVAGQVWQEKAARYATKFDITADGSTLNRSQLMKNAMAQAAYHNARRAARGSRWHKHPKEVDSSRSWIGNLPEQEG